MIMITMKCLLNKWVNELEIKNKYTQIMIDQQFPDKETSEKFGKFIYETLFLNLLFVSSFSSSFFSCQQKIKQVWTVVLGLLARLSVAVIKHQN